MKILDMLVEMVRVVHGLASTVARHDRDLAQQMRRASTSAGLNASGRLGQSGEAQVAAGGCLWVLAYRR